MPSASPAFQSVEGLISECLVKSVSVAAGLGSQGQNGIDARRRGE
jgi:hypothetical protein